MKKIIYPLILILASVLWPLQGHAVTSEVHYSLAELQKSLQHYNIALKNWGGITTDKFTFPKTKKHSKKRWLKLLHQQFVNTATLKQKTYTVLYVLPVGINAKRVSSVIAYSQAKSNTPFADFKRKNLQPIKQVMQLSEVKLLQGLDKNEQQQGIYYERFINPPQDVSAYSFSIQYVPELKTMAPIVEETSKNEGLEGYARAGSVLDFIRANKSEKWQQYRSKSGMRYLSMQAADAPVFAMQQHGNGTITIAMQTTMPDGTPFKYVMNVDGQTFTTTTNIISSAGLITLLDFATLGGKP